LLGGDWKGAERDSERERETGKEKGEDGRMRREAEAHGCPDPQVCGKNEGRKISFAAELTDKHLLYFSDDEEDALMHALTRTYI